METYVIEGGNRLEGEVKITGAKNAVLGILAATILCQDKFRIESVPHIKDVNKFLNILKKIGAKVKFEDNVLEIDTTAVDRYDCSDLVSDCSKMRASYYLLGAFLGRFKKAIVPMPGGCSIGLRPIDQHIKGFEVLGADVKERNGNVVLRAEELTPGLIDFTKVSVGATINVMLASVLVPGKTTITNAAREPHVVDVANFLNLMGAKIRGAGTDTITVYGVDELHGCEYTVIPDQIATGTYMIAAAATEGNVLIKNTIPKHMEKLTNTLRQMGVSVEIEDDNIRVSGKRPYKGTEVETQPYPGFPTDLQPPLAALMMICRGKSKISEKIFENRFEFIAELIRMGGDAEVYDQNCVIHGVPKLFSAQVKAPDLRAGAALVIAALVAEGKSVITDIKYIDRGYEKFEENLTNLGAKIERVEQD